MASKRRVEYPGDIYPVMNRGDRHEEVGWVERIVRAELQRRRGPESHLTSSATSV